MSKPILHIRLVKMSDKKELILLTEEITELLKDDYHVIVTYGELEFKIIK